MTWGFVFQSAVLRLFLKYILLFNSSIGMMNFQWTAVCCSYINLSKGSSFQVKSEVCNLALPENLIKANASYAHGEITNEVEKGKRNTLNQLVSETSAGLVGCGVVLRLQISTQRFKLLHLQRTDLNFRSFFFFFEADSCALGKILQRYWFPSHVECESYGRCTRAVWEQFFRAEIGCWDLALSFGTRCHDCVLTIFGTYVNLQKGSFIKGVEYLILDQSCRSKGKDFALSVNQSQRQNSQQPTC